ncbi:hypothetical protein EDD16DRAFT_1647081 [Pisolithus croceorrhizus]|nr:hypothetical protein EDD16DRAFT_1647081 [Pisolithus croceorrhizus]
MRLLASWLPSTEWGLPSLNALLLSLFFPSFRAFVAPYYSSRIYDGTCLNFFREDPARTWGCAPQLDTSELHVLSVV